ncbi:MAG: hypothetical protein ACR2NZ_20605 [Rubripirellula sp.]
MILDADQHSHTGNLPKELVDFARRQFVNATYYRGGERRSEQRHVLMIPVVVVCVDEDNQPLDEPFEVITRDVSATSVGLFHTDEIKHDRIAVHMLLAGTEVNLIVSLKWRSPMGPFYGSGGIYIEKLEQFPCDLDSKV